MIDDLANHCGGTTGEEKIIDVDNYKNCLRVVVICPK